MMQQQQGAREMANQFAGKAGARNREMRGAGKAKDVCAKG